MHFQHQCYPVLEILGIFWTLLSPIGESSVSVRTQAIIICCIKKQVETWFPLAGSVVEFIAELYCLNADDKSES